MATETIMLNFKEWPRQLYNVCSVVTVETMVSVFWVTKLGQCGCTRLKLIQFL